MILDMETVIKTLNIEYDNNTRINTLKIKSW